MRRYSDPIEVRSVPEVEMSALDAIADKDDALAARPGSPQAFIWHGRLYVVRRVLAHWHERRAWWRDALDPAVGEPTGIDVASREQHLWRVEASPGQAFSVGVFDLTADDQDWRLVRVAD
ncbi:DUF6504 family protein [Lapillicoccus sp.]|uniref:DUF6504 family protein n=1 Tax=Lapillicoccus sp. TaxID=1909287 RepID=UPI00326442C0